MTLFICFWRKEKRSSIHNHCRNPTAKFQNHTIKTPTKLIDDFVKLINDFVKLINDFVKENFTYLYEIENKKETRKKLPKKLQSCQRLFQVLP